MKVWLSGVDCFSEVFRNFLPQSREARREDREFFTTEYAEYTA